MLAAMHNAIDYPLRQFFRWRRRGLRFRNESKNRLFAHLPEPDRAAAQTTASRLLNDYHLQPFHQNSRAENCRENLYYLEMLERALNSATVQLPSHVVAADIGPSHWFYAQALYSLCKWWGCSEGRQVALAGYEADAYRVYTDFYSRYDHALAHMRGLPGTRYLPQRFETQPATFDLITMLFPFIFARDHLAWGLPHDLFSPTRLLADAWHSLKPSGLLVIVNQGQNEHETQRRIMLESGIQPSAAFRFESLLFQYDLPRFVLTATHD